MTKLDYETEDVIAEMKVSIPKEKLRQMELCLLSFPEAIGTTLVNEGGSVIVWMEKKSNIKATEVNITPENPNLELVFKFIFPPMYGIYDNGDGIVYIFGDVEISKIEDVIEHETLHYAVQIVAGKQACIELDNICRDWLRVVKE